MKKNCLMVVIVLTLSVLASGCADLMDSVRGKSVNLESDVYGAKAVVVDPSTGAAAPTGEFGFGNAAYHSARMQEGQPYYTRRTTWSIWGDRKSSETEVWIGRTNAPSILEFEVVPESLVVIHGDGTVRSGSTTVTVSPTSKTSESSKTSSSSNSDTSTKDK